MALDTAAPLAFLAALVAAQPGVQGVVIGAPTSLDKRLSAYVACAGQVPIRKATDGLLQRRARYLVVLGYRTGGDAAAAELALPAVIDALTRALAADPTLGGTAEDATLDASGGDSIEYRPYAGQEFRQYPLVIEATQRETVPLAVP